jgi:hypothetical protein
MVALSVSAHLKSESLAEFTFVLQQRIHPSLKKIKGFRGHIVLVLPDAREAVAISLWDEKVNESAEEDATSKVLPPLSQVIQNRPTIKVCDFLEKSSGDMELLQSLAAVVGEDAPLQILEVSRFVFQHFTMDTLV